MKALIGVSSVALIEGVQHIPTGGTPLVEVVKLVIQLVVGIGSLWQMFKKPKPQPQTETEKK